MRCTGKGNKVRVAPFGEQAKVHLQRYLNEVRPKLAADRPTRNVFLTLRGTKLSRKTIWKHIRRYARLAGITTMSAVDWLWIV